MGPGSLVGGRDTHGWTDRQRMETGMGPPRVPNSKLLFAQYDIFELFDLLGGKLKL